MAAPAGKRAIAANGPRIGETGKFEGEFTCVGDGKASYITHRTEVWERLLKKHHEREKTQPRKPIKIELPDGKVLDGTSFETTPLEIAQGISKGLADSVIVAKVLYKEPIASLKACVNADAESDDEEEAEAHQVAMWDLTRPLEGSCRLELLKFDNPQGQYVFWHSSAHVLGQAMEREFGCHLTVGPPLENGFYYDGYFGDRKLHDKDFEAIEKLAQKVCSEKHPFERCVLSKDDALELFKENPFKVQLISKKVPDGAMTSCYKCGPLIDLCRGPHIINTGKVKEFAITKNSAAYWLGDQSLDSLQRLYAVAFPTKDLMKEWKKFQEEAAKRDHRNIGKQQELFFFHANYSPGSCFWFPMGTRINNRLTQLMRNEYKFRGFHEVITPNMYHTALFKVSGHYQNYKDDMYSLDIEKQEWMLKPMNCPGHFVMFDARARSYKELPLRFADFGVLHRNEASGALSGLTRVRRFQQDDAHLFVRPDQIKQEVLAGIDFLNYVYSLFGFEAHFALSTRPKKALGSKEIWDNAETQLKAALNESGKEWTLNPGDGAFYGPKIDIRLTDAMRRKHQCGTIQLDFNNPIRFNLQYRSEHAEDTAVDEEKAEFHGAEEKDEDGHVIWKEGRLKNGFERPVVIHRAILGSLERFTAIITEHFAGKWPFWLSPRQVMIVPVNEKCNSYAKWLEEQLTVHGFYADSDLSGKTLNKKVRESQMAQWNFIAVVGEKEMTDFSVNLRQRDVERPIGTFSLRDMMAKFEAEAMPGSRKVEFTPFEGRVPQVAAAEPPAGAAPPTPVANGASGSPNRRSSVQLRKQCPDLSDGDVEHQLELHPYVKGFAPTQADKELFAQFCDSTFPETPNLKRWFEHMESFSKAERDSWPVA